MLACFPQICEQERLIEGLHSILLLNKINGTQIVLVESKHKERQAFQQKSVSQQ
jgi:hypothetical protein